MNDPRQVNATSETAALRADIDETRAHMSETIDELGERLNPQHVREQITERVKDGIRDATIGRARHMARQAGDKVRHASDSVLDVVRENPIPVAMLGVGAAWLLMNGRGGRRHDMRNTDSTWHGASEPYVEDWDHVSEEGGDGLPAKVREKAEAVREKAEAVVDRSEDVVHRAAARTRRAAERVGHQARRQARQAEDYYYRNPLVLGVLALGAGLALGMAAPASEAENRWFGDARDRVVDKARKVAREKGTQVQHVAERVYEEGKRVARETAEEEGLTHGLLDDRPGGATEQSARL